MDSYDNSPGYSPPPIDWEAIERRKRLEEEERNKKNQVIAVTRESLVNLSNNELMNFLRMFLYNHPSLVKKYCVAMAINNKMAEIAKNNPEADPEKIKKGFLKEIFEPHSDLYQQLNYQRSLLRITVGGEMKAISVNYAKTLQSAHAAAIREQTKTGASHSTKKSKHN